MDLFEYQGKQYFAKFGIPVSAGGVAHTVDEAVAEAEKAKYPVVVKAQVQVGGRGKAGGIKLATNADEVRLHAGNILGMDITGIMMSTGMKSTTKKTLLAPKDVVVVVLVFSQGGEARGGETESERCVSCCLAARAPNVSSCAPRRRTEVRTQSRA